MISLPIPLWHKKIENINLELQPDKLIDKYVANGFHIYKSTWEELRKVLDGNFAKLYSNGKLYTRNQEKEKIEKIVACWNQGLHLIPPMLIHLENNTLVPADGKHRLKVASIADLEEIYFILFDTDLKYINSYFQPKLVH